MTSDILKHRQQQVLHDKKWIKFLRRTWLFRWIPFVEFALAAGSLVTGNVHIDSDFDVIVGAMPGRIFTARFFSVIGFGFFGWRRKRLSHKEAAADKVCLNHFVTEKSYRLSPPHNAYWQNLYQNLVPVYGAQEKINKFFAANADWLSQSKVIVRPYIDDLRHIYRTGSFAKKIREWILDGCFGNWLERKLKALQVARIEKSFGTEAGYKPRVIYSDDELEFHPDTRRIELLTKDL